MCVLCIDDVFFFSFLCFTFVVCSINMSMNASICEDDTNQICVSVSQLLVSERSEGDTSGGCTIRAGAVYVYIWVRGGT